MISSSQLSLWIFEKEDIWQLDLKNARGLASFINEREVGFWEDHIFHLWQLGWVRAEFIRSRDEPEINGFDLLGKIDEEESLYTDNRELGMVQIHEEEPVRELVEKIPDVVPYFHPFKYFIFWEIQRVIRLNIHPYQMLIPGEYHGILDREIDLFYRWIQSDNSKAQFNRWDEIARLAIASEPCFFPEIIGSLKHPALITFEEQVANIMVYKTMLKDYYLQIGIETIKEIIEDLCTSAEMIEPNKSIHSLMRFMNGIQRLKTKGSLGGAILLKFMAEVIRHMAEWSFDIQLPEEDEMGFGMWVEGAKERIYGSKRIFDAHGLLAKRQFIRGMGLDAEVRIRFYVEGPTEYSALNHLLKGWQQIEVIDLAGQFVQGKRKGLAFRDNLILDDRAGVFSVIMLDGDRDDNIRVVQMAAQEDLFCGQFYVSKPDFELNNFSEDELVEIIWDLIDDQEKSDQIFSSLRATVMGSTSAGAIINTASGITPGLHHLKKGKEWGEKLAEYAAKQPTKNNSDETRPFVEACQVAIRSINDDYQLTRAKYRVDPNTGKLVKRESLGLNRNQPS